MIGVLTDVAARCAMLPALVLTPYLIVRVLFASMSLPVRAAATGAVSVFLNVAVPVGLHVLATPVTAPHLAAVHWGLFLVLLLAARLRHLDIGARGDAQDRALLLAGLLFALLVIPFTHLAGIDTYKWQDLATSVRVQASIPWLVHPLSLFGFTPRSYPSAQPLLLATVQILGGLGVEAGFFIVSVFCGTLGLLAAHLLGQRLFPDGRQATLFTIFYVFSPVFMRYNHWATGRGLFVALFPLFLASWLALPRPSAIPAVLATGLLLALSHKVGLVAVVFVGLAAIPALCLPRRGLALPLLAAAAAAAALAILLSPRFLLPGLAGRALGAARFAVTRFCWLVPAAGLGLFAPAAWLASPPRRRLLPAFLLSLPLAFPANAYGGLIALPFMVMAASIGLFHATERWPARRSAIASAAIALSMLGAVGIVLHRANGATTDAVWRAAQFLERYDPHGPYMVYATAPGRVRDRVQGYVSGCPRFSVAPPSNALPTMTAPPPFLGPPRQVYSQWTDYLRGFFSLPGIAVAYYGDAPRAYYIVVDGVGPKPANGRTIYHEDDVEIREPTDQQVP